MLGARFQTLRPRRLNPDPAFQRYLPESCCADDGAPHPATATAVRTAEASWRWQRVLAGSGAVQRPEPRVWSPTEYACHVRDMLSLLGSRVELMLETENPSFSNWDQNQVAVGTP